MSQQQSGIFSRDSVDQYELHERAHQANILANKHFGFIDGELQDRMVKEAELDRQESMERGELVQSTRVDYVNGVVLKTSRNLPEPGEKRHNNQDLVKVIEIAPGVQMSLLIDGATEADVGKLSNSEEMAARYSQFLEEGLFPNFKSDLPEILTQLTGLPSDALNGIDSLENLMKNTQHAFVDWAKANKGKPGFENYDNWAGFGYMSMVFPIRRKNRRGELTNNIIVIETGTTNHQHEYVEEKDGVQKLAKKVRKGDSGHVVIVNGNDAESGITISSVFSDDLMMAESDKEYNPIEFPDNTLKGYNVWFGAKPNTKRNDVHIVRPDIGLTAFRLTVVEGLKDDAITVNVSDAARMHSPDPNDPRLYTVNPFDDLSQTITTNMV